VCEENPEWKKERERQRGQDRQGADDSRHTPTTASLLLSSSPRLLSPVDSDPADRHFPQPRGKSAVPYASILTKPHSTDKKSSAITMQIAHR
jgi:hypothetical protein